MGEELETQPKTIIYCVILYENYNWSEINLVQRDSM